MSYHHLPMYKATLPPFLSALFMFWKAAVTSPRAFSSACSQSPPRPNTCLRREVTHPLSAPTVSSEMLTWRKKAKSDWPEEQPQTPTLTAIPLSLQQSLQTLLQSLSPLKYSLPQRWEQHRTTGPVAHIRHQETLKCWQEHTDQSPVRFHSQYSLCASQTWVSTRDTKAQRSSSFPPVTQNVTCAAQMSKSTLGSQLFLHPHQATAPTMHQITSLSHPATTRLHSCCHPAWSSPGHSCLYLPCLKHHLRHRRLCLQVFLSPLRALGQLLPAQHPQKVFTTCSIEN